jgi:hypothetical protein
MVRREIFENSAKGSSEARTRATACKGMQATTMRAVAHRSSLSPNIRDTSLAIGEGDWLERRGKSEETARFIE